MVLTAGYEVSYGLETCSLRTHRPTFSIEFSAGCSLNAIQGSLFGYLAFLSFVLGGRMAPEEVRIDRMSFEEKIRAVEAGTYIDDHAIIWNWPAEGHEAKDLAFYGAPFMAMNDGELTSFVAGLITWFERIDEWRAASVRMTESLRLRREISGERLLAAWRWFEEVPPTKAKRVIDNDVVEYLTEAALKGAREKCLGAHIEDRIKGSLTRIGEESMRDRFERLIHSVEERFERNDCLDGMVNHLQNARCFRGRIAHGHFSSRNAAELRQFNKATLAMEALCFLLTARDLPLSEEAKKRIWAHPILEEYQLAYD
ncbi:hypothetical protein DL1_03235 [Thioclava dalianensis]|uniref:Apea-like HEPN domain-containing protein n=2 Tax=Thioclava dalianensis TaxID=1185766 RepID=A0A074TKY4_9RHOB|nr:hypothetical protein DL1_03235 [Thioclava dalianensis]SFN15911.1 hypothetical protein SAMN05216224_102709 [Thioclava dalianensis]